MSVRHLWIINKSGLCILEEAFLTDNKKKMDETLMGGFIAALFSFSESMTSTGIDSLSMGEIIMHYASGEDFITCLAVDKKVKPDVAKETVKRIHSEFLNQFSGILETHGAVDTTLFLPFKDYSTELLLSLKLLPKNFIQKQSESEKISEESAKVSMLIQTLMQGEDPKKIAQDLRSMFTILGSTKDGKEFRKVLVDFDKFVNKLQIDEDTTKKVMSLISEIRSFATIDEWLG